MPAPCVKMEALPTGALLEDTMLGASQVEAAFPHALCRAGLLRGPFQAQSNCAPATGPALQQR